MKIKLMINLDEIDDKLYKSILFLNELDIKTCELRKINGINIGKLLKNDILLLKETLNINGIKPISIASPLFKWNVDAKNTIELDNYGINPNLTQYEKIQIIKNIIDNARLLDIKIVRIFSGIDKNIFSETDCDDYTLLKKLISNKDIDFLVENEPSCSIKTKNDYLKLIKILKMWKTKNIWLWLDISNFYLIGENLDEEFIKKISPYIRYIHVKDFKRNAQGDIEYVAIGKGILDYKSIFSKLNKYIPNSQPIIVSIETHARANKKYSYSKESIKYFKYNFKKIIEG